MSKHAALQKRTHEFRKCLVIVRTGTTGGKRVIAFNVQLTAYAMADDLLERNAVPSLPAPRMPRSRC